VLIPQEIKEALVAPHIKKLWEFLRGAKARTSSKENPLRRERHILFDKRPRFGITGNPEVIQRAPQARVIFSPGILSVHCFNFNVVDVKLSAA